MDFVRTLLIHLKGRQYRGVLKTILRYFKVKYWKYSNKTVQVSIRDQEKIRLIMNPGCTVSEKLYVVGLYDPCGMRALEEIITSGDVFYDVGANIGPFSLLAHSFGASVYAFEGHPETVERCRQNFKENGIDPERVLSTAISDYDGDVFFTNVPGSSVNKIEENKNGRHETIKVPVLSLDTFKQTHDSPTIIKIDTEGHELHVIKGLKSILGNGNVKYLTFEANGLSSKDELHEIFNLLSEANYMIGSIDWDQKKFFEISELGEKSDTGDYMAISKKWKHLFEARGVTVKSGK